MAEEERIKCPWCSAVLIVRRKPGMESMNVTCPVCKRQYPYVQFKPVEEAADGGNTCYPVREGNGPDGDGRAAGSLSIPSTGQSLPLRLGKNIVGRESPRGNADVPIDTRGNKRISREHLIINVYEAGGKGLVHAVSLFKERVNPTSINGVPLSYGDTIVLRHGDVINLPDLDVRFVLPDAEATQL